MLEFQSCVLCIAESVFCTSMNGIGKTTSTLSKVPVATLAFWAAKIIATTLGETGGDAVSMSANLGYALSSLVFLAFFLAAVTAQILAKRYHAALYWMVVVATTTVGTTTSDYQRPRGLVSKAARCYSHL
jgi:uncharacterized membrane-anchored protein